MSITNICASEMTYLVRNMVHKYENDTRTACCAEKHKYVLNNNEIKLNENNAFCTNYGKLV